jgi:hypothetical protein
MTMRIRSLLPLLAVPALIACGGAEDFDTPAPVHETAAEAPAMSPEVRLQGILHVVNDLSRDDLLSEAHVEPELADAIIAARAEGFRFTSQEQVDQLLNGSLPMATNPLCAYYEGLAQYYAIRALQCAYSACYPMVPWYGYMAEYYNGLVETFCR